MTPAPPGASSAPETSSPAAAVASPRRSTTRPLPRAQRRRAIVAGAARAFATGGFDSTSMEDIAEAAGVSKLILYRHFDSKEELYRSIVEQVSGRLGDETAAEVERGRRRGVFVRAFLAVAREDPDGFRLLWRHASREPQFAAYGEEVRAAAVAFARVLLSPRLAEQKLLDWSAATIVDFLVQASLNWLDHGRPEDDEMFVDVATRSLEAMFRSWSS